MKLNKDGSMKEGSLNYRVTMLSGGICVEGYGATPYEAGVDARKQFTKKGGDVSDVTDTVLEHAVPSPDGGSHYEEIVE